MAKMNQFGKFMARKIPAIARPRDATTSNAGDDDNKDAGDAAAKVIEAQAMNDKLARTQGNIEKGRCNPYCNQVDILHSVAFFVSGNKAMELLGGGEPEAAAEAAHGAHGAHEAAAHGAHEAAHHGSIFFGHHGSAESAIFGGSVAGRMMVADGAVANQESAFHEHNHHHHTHVCQVIKFHVYEMQEAAKAKCASTPLEDCQEGAATDYMIARQGWESDCSEDAHHHH